jgi:hypothetical protein
MQLTLNILDTSLSPLQISIGGIDINGTQNPAPSSSLSVTINDGESATINVTESNYYPYSMTIDNVYNSDKVIDVVMVQKTLVNDPDYLKPFPRFFTFNDPCSYRVDFYNASSFTGNTSYYVNNEHYRTGNKGTVDFFTVGDYQLKIRTKTFTILPHSIRRTRWDNQWATDIVGVTGNTVAEDIQPIKDYLDLDLNTNTTVVEYKPDIDIEVTGLTADDCYLNDQIISVFANVTLNRPNADILDHTIEYVVTLPNGLTIDETYPLDSNTAIDVDLNQLGIYNINVIVTDGLCNNVFNAEYQVVTCNFIQFTYTCDKYIISNKGTKDVTYQVEIFDNEGNIELVPETPLINGTIAEIISDPALLIVTVKYDDVEQQYVLNNYCQLEKCLASYIEDILCGEKPRCNPCPDPTELNQMLLLMYTYFGKLHKEYGYNNFYNGLSQSKLIELASIKDTMDKILEFCDRNNCISDCGFTGYKPYDTPKSKDCNSCK